MFCPQCGTKNPDGAAFCGNCGNSLAQRAAAQPTPYQAAPAAAPAYAGAAYSAQPVAKKNDLLGNSKVLLIVAVAVVLLLVLLIRAFACSGPGTPNLIDLATKDTNSVVNTVKNYKAAVIAGNTYFTSDDKALNEIYVATLSMNSGGEAQNNAIKTLQKCKDAWFMQIGYNSDVLDSLSLNTTNPTRVQYGMIVDKEKLTTEDAASILSKVAKYDRCVFHAKSVGLSADPEVHGMGKGNGCVSTFNASPVKDSSGSVKVWMVTITTYSIAEDRNGVSKSNDFDTDYENWNNSSYDSNMRKG